MEIPARVVIPDESVDALIHSLLETVDHDIAKDYRVETAEEPDEVEGAMNELRDVFDNWLAGLATDTAA